MKQKDGHRDSMKASAKRADALKSWRALYPTHESWDRWWSSIELHKLGSYCIKLDGVGPFDNRPSTDKLQRFFQNK